MKKIEDLLSRSDIVGGTFKMFDQSKQMFFRSIISKMERDGREKEIVFTCNSQELERQQNGRTVWVHTSKHNLVYRYPLDMKLIGGEIGPHQFDIPSGFVVIYRKVTAPKEAFNGVRLIK